MIRVQRSLMLAGAICVNAGILFGAALVRALSTETVEPAAVQRAVPADNAEPAHETPPGPARRAAPAGGQHGDARRASNELDTDAVMLAVENDPFRPERQRPSERYRLPGEEIPQEAPPPQAPPPPPLRVLATAVMPTGGLALVRVQESVNRVINVGETVSGYRLATVGAGTATLEGSAGLITLRVDEPQATRATRAATPRGGRGQPSGRGNAPARELEARGAQVRDAIERLRANGGNAQQIQQLMELLGREMEQMRRTNVEVQRVPGGANQIIIRPRADTMSNRN